MPLFLAPLDTEMTVTRVSADQNVRLHLCEMGISTGSKITVLQSTNGNLITAVMEGRVCLDRSLAAHIYVA